MDRSIELEFDGCACSDGNIDGTEIVVHCHRVGCDFGCKYAGVHYNGDKKVAEKVAKYISKNFFCDVEVVEDNEL